MFQEKAKRKIVFTLLLFGLSVISFSNGFDSSLKLNAYAQTYTPSNADTGSADIVPENNYSNIGSSSLGSNSTSMDNMTDPMNQTNLGLPNGTSSNNNTTSQGLTQSAIPEFGPLAQVVLIIAVLSIIIFRTKFSTGFRS